jgi:hypothetical protein
MLWTVMAVTLVVSFVAVILVIFASHDANVDDLGCVSNRWIAEHRVDSL